LVPAVTTRPDLFYLNATLKPNAGEFEMNTLEAESIPGMIEPSERELLYKLSRALAFVPGECVVEFGAFFGRSTNCIAQGLAANETFKANCAFYTYDSFECDENGGFAPHVLAFAELSKTADLIARHENKLNFYPVFEHFMASYINKGIVAPIKKELADSFPKSESILMMHIDSPKFYEEFKIILFRFLPRAKAGSPIVFQDFFYHWSASLIAAVSLLIKRGDIVIVESAASSLLCRVVEEVTLEKACELDLAFQNAYIPDLIDQAIAYVSTAKIDRPEYFIPRLWLAKMQWLIEQGEYASAMKVVSAYKRSGGKINKFVMNDLLELIKYKFSIRRVYQIDHV
jgi:hypothetical protein